MATQGLTPGELSLRRIKTRFYMVALPAAIIAAVLIWYTKLASGAIDTFDQLALPAIAGWLTVIFVLILYGIRRRRGEPFMRRLEVLVITTGVGLFVGRQYWLLFPGYDTARTTTELLSISPWLNIMYLLVFLVLPRGRAIALSLGYLAASFGLGMLHVVPEILEGRDLHELNLVGQMTLSGAAAIGLLYILAVVKERYAAAEAHAETMAQMAMTDFLTGLPNRRQITEIVDGEIGLALRHGRPFSVIMIDLDRFKLVNDRLGHDSGDAVLAGVAGVVKGDLRVSDWPGRWGGDELLIVAPETTLDQAALLADRLRHHVEDYDAPHASTVTATFGVASFRIGDTVETLVKRADEALYRGKAAGRNRVEIGDLAA